MCHLPCRSEAALAGATIISFSKTGSRFLSGLRLLRRYAVTNTHFLQGWISLSGCRWLSDVRGEDIVPAVLVDTADEPP